MAIERLEDSKPPAFVWDNLSDFHRALNSVLEPYSDHEFWEIPSLAFSRIPAPRLKVTDPSFQIDYFSKSVHRFASERLQRTLDVGPQVRFRPIDDSLCPKEVKAQKYAMFDVVCFGNPFDSTRMTGVERNVRQVDGSMHHEWVVDWEHLTRSPDVFFRSDFVAPAPIFRAVGTTWIFVTDALADQVMRAGIQDVTFTDISGPSAPGVLRSRSL